MRRPKLPKIGDEIYVPSEFYLGHGSDDLIGGLARVTRVELITKLTTGPNAGKHFVIVEEVFGSRRWGDHLDKMQAELKKEFGKRRAHPEPDDRPEFNRWG